MSPIYFRVIGEPAPQGSKRHVGHGIMVESSAKVRPWRQDVALAATEARRGAEPINGPLYLKVTFFLRRPKSAPKRRTLPDRKPDIDKLLRSTLDAIVTAGLIRDDAQITSTLILKRFAEAGDSLGAFIRLFEDDGTLR